jgi:hypothetical protein
LESLYGRERNVLPPRERELTNTVRYDFYAAVSWEGNNGTVGYLVSELRKAVPVKHDLKVVFTKLRSRYRVSEPGQLTVPFNTLPECGNLFPREQLPVQDRRRRNIETIHTPRNTPIVFKIAHLYSLLH